MAVLPAPPPARPVGGSSQEPSMPAVSRSHRGRVFRVMFACATAGAAGALVLGHASAPASPNPVAPGRTIPAHFVGLSLEWSLVERYMSPRSRPAFANLLRNL